MYSIILICLIIILLINKLFNTKFEKFYEFTDDVENAVDQKHNFQEPDPCVNAEAQGISMGGACGVPNPYTETNNINTTNPIIIPRLCESKDCKERETRWFENTKSNLICNPDTFKMIMNRIGRIN